jgi:hypothetical protein
MDRWMNSKGSSLEFAEKRCKKAQLASSFVQLAKPDKQVCIAGVAFTQQQVAKMGQLPARFRS